MAIRRAGSSSRIGKKGTLSPIIFSGGNLSIDQQNDNRSRKLASTQQIYLNLHAHNNEFQFSRSLYGILRHITNLQLPCYFVEHCVLRIVFISFHG